MILLATLDQMSIQRRGGCKVNVWKESFGEFFQESENTVVFWLVMDVYKYMVA